MRRDNGAFFGARRGSKTLDLAGIPVGDDTWGATARIGDYFGIDRRMFMESTVDHINAREITEHHDGHGLNESIMILADPVDQKNGNASHRYEMSIGGKIVAGIQFQHGPRNEDGSTPGVTEAALVAVLIDRLRGFQAGPYSCRENAIQLTKLEEVLHWTKARADARAKRGVLGKNEK